jgi:hypothetical protein
MLGPHNTVKVDVYRETTSRHPTGVETKSWGDVPLIEKMRCALQKMTGGQAERAYGLNSESRWRMLVDGDYDVRARDLIVVRTGPDAGGTNLEVVDVIKIAGRVLNVALKDTNETPDA